MSRITLSNPYDYYFSAGVYWAYNNVWNTADLTNGKDYTQTISLDTSKFPGGTTLSWSYPAATQTLAFPEVIYGYNPWTGVNSASSPDSTQVANFTDLTMSYNFSISGQTGNFDVALDMWLTSVPSGGASSITHEIMVILYDPWGMQAGASPVTTIDGFGAYDHGEIGNDLTNWDLVQYESTSRGSKLSGTIDIGTLLKNLADAGVITGTEYLSGIEVGAEVSGGRGSLTMNSLSFNWAGSDSILGSSGNDSFKFSAPGDHHVIGGGGTDTVTYAGKFSGYDVNVDGGVADVVKGTAIGQMDALEGIHYIRFDDGTYDTSTKIFTPDPPPPIVGTSRNDTLNGTSGADSINGLAGQDKITGNSGNDTLTGGADGDSFYFGLNSGVDTLTDFTPGRDDVYISSAYHLSVNQLLQHLTPTPDGALLTLDNHDSVLFEGDSVASLQSHASDWHLF